MIRKPFPYLRTLCCVHENGLGVGLDTTWILEDVAILLGRSEQANAGHSPQIQRSTVFGFVMMAV